MFSTLARGYWERTAEAWTMPSRYRSSQYSPVPSTLPRTSARKARSPTPKAAPSSRAGSMCCSPRRMAPARAMPSMIFL